MIYLSDKISELPKNCLFDKGKVGCGGTTLAIEGSEPYVIAVPYASLVENKVRQYPNERYPYRIFGVSEGVTPDSVRKYLSQAASPKIMTTYDSLGKVIEAFGDVSGVNLLIDEYHILFTQYSFRKNAIMGVLENFKRFRSFTFMTATPLEADFILDELKGIPVVTQVWDEDERFTISVKQVQCKSVLASAFKMIKAFLSGEIEGNAYFFVNSVKAIKVLIKKAGLTEKECRAIYSKSNPMNVGVPNSDVDSAPKKINFLTSTVFEGCDIFDRDGVTIILSDHYFKNSLLDISTSVQQIAGRIRDSRYIGRIYHLFKNNRYYGELSTEDYQKYIAEETERNKRLAEEYNSLDEEARRSIKELDLQYIEKGDDNRFHFDPNRPKIDLFNFKVSHIYSSNVTVSEEYRQHLGIDTETSTDRLTLESLDIAGGAGIDKSFKEVVQEIRNTDSLLHRNMKMREARFIYPFLSDAIHKLGFERIESLKYSQRAVQDELNLISDNSTDFKICRRLGYSIGDFHSNADIKSDLKKAYKSLMLKRAAKAVDISKFYVVKKAKKRIRGELKEGYIILSPKYRIAA